MVGSPVRRGDLLLVSLNPARGGEIRAVDHERIVRRLGRMSPGSLNRALAVLQEMFAG